MSSVHKDSRQTNAQTLGWTNQRIYGHKHIWTSDQPNGALTNLWPRGRVRSESSFFFQDPESRSKNLSRILLPEIEGHMWIGFFSILFIPMTTILTFYETPGEVHYGPEQKKNTAKNSYLIIHFPTSTGVSEWEQRSTRAKQAVWIKQCGASSMEQAVRANKRTDERVAQHLHLDYTTQRTGNFGAHFAHI